MINPAKLLIFLFCVAFINSHAQKITTFQKSFGTIYNEYPSSVLALPDRGFLVSGVIGAPSFSKILLIRTDSLGKLIWSKSYGNSDGSGTIGYSFTTTAMSITLSKDGNIVVCSNTEISNKSPGKVFLFKIKPDGSLIWSKKFSNRPFVDQQYPTSIIMDPDGGFLISILEDVYNSRNRYGYQNIKLIKTDSMGSVIWEKHFNDSTHRNIIGNAAIASKNGGYLICGASSPNGSDVGSLVLKIDKNGKMLWSKVYESSSSIVSNSILELPDNSIYLFGFINAIPNSPTADLASIIKLDSSGKLLWSKSYTYGPTSPYHEQADLLFETPLYNDNKKIFHIGYQALSDIGNKKPGNGIIRIDTSGNIIFTKIFASSTNLFGMVVNLGKTMSETQGGGFVRLGLTNIYGVGGYDLFLVKTDSAANTGTCHVNYLNIYPSDFPLYENTYSLNTFSITPKADTGCNVLAANISESIVCQPFVCWFGCQGICQNDSIRFIDSSYNLPNQWKWNFDDPYSKTNISTDQNPSHVFNSPGTYHVKLVSGNGIVSDSVIRTIFIYPLPNKFKFDTLICAGSPIKLRASGGYKYIWMPNFLVSDSSLANPFALLKKTSTLFVTAISKKGCINYDTVHITVDPKPSQPKINYATVISDNEIDIHFQKSDSADVKNYLIYRSVNGAGYKNLGGMANLSNNNANYVFSDKTVSAGLDNYAYKLVAIDSCGAPSDTTLAHQPVLLQVNRLGCQQILQLNWSEYLGWPAIKKYEIHRVINGGKDSLLATLNSATTAFNDSGLDHKNLYCYRIFAYDNADSFVSSSNIACGQTFFPDTPKLFTISKISTSLTNGSVIIKWKSNTKPNYAYVNLYQSNNGKTFSRIGGNFPPTIDSFVQTGLITQTADQYYYLVSVDSCGQQSARSPINKTMDLTVSVGQLVHKLNWTPYYGFKIKKYNIERLDNGIFHPIDSVTGNDTFSREFPAPCNYAIRYRIVAVGYNAGEYSWSDSMGRQAIDTQPPNKVNIKELTMKGQVATINYLGSDSPDVYKYVIERSINGKWAVLKNFAFTKPGTKNQLTDSLKNLPAHACYTIITLDSCLNAAVSDTVCSIHINIRSLFCTKHFDLAWDACSTDSTKHIVSCPDSLVIYRSDNGKPFKTLKNLNGNTGSYVDTAILIGSRYVYKMTAYSKKSGIYSYSDTIGTIPRIIPEAGGAQLVYSTVIKTDPKYGQIFVQWKRADTADTNARGYYIYSFDTISGKYTLLRDEPNLNITTYTNTNINTLQHSYKYYIITYNVCNTGSGSAIHKPVLLKINNKNLQADLNWTDYLGESVKNYSVYKSIDGGKPFLLKDAGTDSNLVDSNIHCTHSYTYQIQAVLANGKISFSDSVTIKAEDTIKPITQPLLFATVTKTGSGNGQNLINWNPAQDKNMAGYNLYRSTDGATWYLDHVLAGLTQIDTDLNTYGLAYYYKIQPIDSCGNLGAFSTIHKTIHLKANAGNQFINLNWNAYMGWRVKAYQIYRNGTLIAIQPKDSLHFRDTLVVCTQLYKYKIKAICDSTIANLYSESNSDSLKSYDHKAPERVSIKTVTVSDPNKSATLTWAPSSSFDVKNYYIYLKSGIYGNLTLLDTSSTTTYTDTVSLSKNPVIPINPLNPVRNGDCYYIFAHDHCNNISPGSNEGCIIFLNAQNLSGHNDLNWNSYKTWFDGIQSYNVYKNEDNTGWNLIGTTSSGPVHNYFTDKNLGDTTINFCYQVEAVENAGQYNQLSRSTVACVHQDATVFIPNTFSHYNLDGLNDFFAPKGLYIKNYTMKIYNRWGEMVYSDLTTFKKLSNLGWDGTFKGADVPEGVYIYMITVEDYNHHFTNFKGNVMVIGSR